MTLGIPAGDKLGLNFIKAPEKEAIVLF